jgi:hypothetical protein
MANILISQYLRTTFATLAAITCIFATIPIAHAQKAAAPTKAMYSPVPTLNKLHAFEKLIGRGNFCDGFEIGKFDRDEDYGLDVGWSKNKSFLKQIYPFAQATGGGSTYAIWQIKPDDDLAMSPIVVFGDEGGEYVVAKNMDDFLHILAFDVEPSISHTEVHYFKDEDHQASSQHRAYKRWIKNSFDITTSAHPDKIVSAAQAKFGAAFAKWKQQFLP